MERHKEAVAVIADRVQQFYNRKEPFRIYHGSTNSTRTPSLRRNGIVDTSSLKHVLNIDEKKLTALVEPNVAMDELVKVALKHGLVPPVVMEFPGITVGGGFAGTSGESSSFKYGFFNRTVNWVEIVLGNGEIVTASETERADLFHGAAGSFGTLGVTTLLELRLIPAMRYVELTYHPVTSFSEAVQKLEVVSQDPALDYVDGIMFAPHSGVIMTGITTNTALATTAPQTFSRARDPWFYLHAKSLTSHSQGGEAITESIPLPEYLFRYDRGAFWMGVHAFKYFHVPFNALTRWVLDPLLHTRVMYHALHASGHAEQHIIQDLVLPPSNAAPFMGYIDENFGIYPLWLCPLQKLTTPSSFHPNPPQAHSSKININIGVWGPTPHPFPRSSPPPSSKGNPTSPSSDRYLTPNMHLESHLHALHGMKWLYAQSFYTPSQFASLYDLPLHTSLRNKYHAAHLLDVYQKVHTQAEHRDGTSLTARMKRVLWNMWPLSGLYGVGSAVLHIEGAYLLVGLRRRWGWVLGILLGILVAALSCLGGWIGENGRA